MSKKTIKQEPLYVDFEINLGFVNKTSVLSYKVPVHKLEQAVEIAEKYFLLNPKTILTLFVYERKESIYQKSSRVNYVFVQRITLNKF